MKDYPLISIRIPLFNHEDFIEETLESIKIDKYPYKEIIIIDDGSTDNSVHIVERWIANNKDMKVVFKTQKNCGVTKTINKLHTLCSGEYIVGLASDDYLINNSIYLRYKWLLENKHKKVVFTDSEVINEFGKILYTSALIQMNKIKIENYKNDLSLSQEIIKNWGVVGGTIMYHQSILREYHYDEKSKIEDYDFFLFCLSKNYLTFLNISSSRYRLHKNNVSRNKTEYYSRQIDLIRTLQKYLFKFKFKYKLMIFYKIIWLIKKMIIKYVKNMT